VKGEGVVGHLGYGFEDDCVVCGFVWGAAPDEGCVAVDEAGGDGERVDFLLVGLGDKGEARLVVVATVYCFVPE
jgi:hypothetical protein